MLLGVAYEGAEEEPREQFLEDFRSRVLLTYRKGISTPLQLAGGSEITSDAGWGCMLRVMQMMLAQCLVALELGRDWRYDEERDLAEGSPYRDIIACFLDTPDAIFSLHSFVAAGQRLLGKEPSAWFGPTSAAKVAGRLLDDWAPDGGAAPSITGFACVVFEDGAIYKETVLERLSRPGSRAVLVLVCRRLGLDSFNVEEYRAGLESCFTLPEFQGMASGNSGSSAHFFVGTHDDSLLYLDPHTVQTSLESVETLQPGSVASQSLRPARPFPLHWARLNPSICLGFLVRSPEEFLALCAKLVEGPRGEVLEVLEREPCFAERAEETQEGDMVLLE